MLQSETGEDRTGTLELTGSVSHAAVHFTFTDDEGTRQGYLRLAFGQGGLVNRMLNSVGRSGRLHAATGECYSIRITSSEPSRRPGYLCTFEVQEAA